MKYKVFESNLSQTIVFETNDFKEFNAYTDEHKTVADACAIDDLIMLGWDEYDEVTGRLMIG